VALEESLTSKKELEERGMEHCAVPRLVIITEGIVIHIFILRLLETYYPVWSSVN
jgi:hypothetical protein